MSHASLPVSRGHNNHSMCVHLYCTLQDTLPAWSHDSDGYIELQTAVSEPSVVGSRTCARKMQEMSFYILCTAFIFFLYDNTSFSVSFDNGNTGTLGGKKNNNTTRASETITRTMLRLLLRATRAQHSLLLRNWCENSAKTRRIRKLQ